VVDDTSDMHDARDAAIAAGQPLYIPFGTYIVDELTIYNCDVICDPQAIIKTKAGASIAVLLVGSTHWRGGIIDGNRGSVSSGYGMGIFGSYVTVEGATFHDVDGPAIQMGGGYVQRVCDNFITECGSGIYLHPVGTDSDSVGVTIEGNFIDLQSEGAGTYDGIGVAPDGYSVFGLQILSNHIYLPNAPDASGPLCIELFAALLGAGNYFERAVVANNTLVGGGMGISNQTNYSTFKGNTICAAGNYGIEAGGNYNTWQGNVVDGAQFNTTTPQTNTGIILSDSTGGSVVSGNMVVRCDVYGILLSGNHCSLTGNVIQQASNTLLYVTDGDGSTVTGNTLIASGGATAHAVDTPGTVIYRGNVGITDAG
jgi:hypothetical protein